MKVSGLQQEELDDDETSSFTNAPSSFDKTKSYKW